MQALCWRGKKDVRVETVPDAAIINPRDAVIRVTSTAICGSDLHLYDGYIPTLKSGGRSPPAFAMHWSPFVPAGLRSRVLGPISSNRSARVVAYGFRSPRKPVPTNAAIATVSPAETR